MLYAQRLLLMLFERDCYPDGLPPMPPADFIEEFRSWAYASTDPLVRVLVGRVTEEARQQRIDDRILP
jgi:hypothetical protein